MNFDDIMFYDGPIVFRKTDSEPLKSCPHSVRAMVSFFTGAEYYEECDECLRARVLASIEAPQ